MEPLQARPVGLMRSLLILCVFSFLAPTQALYFFVEGGTQKCFYEELPKDTLVVGNYKAEQFESSTESFVPAPSLAITVTVDEVFDHDHRVVNTRGSSEGRFTFSAADSGDHRICFTPSHATASHGWLPSGMSVGGIKLTLDLTTGETSAIESTDKGKISDIVQRVKDLNARLHDIKREQVFQREREAEFRDQSETTNARVVKWTLLQLVVLGVTCAWQLTHLRAFFIKQKLT
ncbi:emp24p/erv25p- protein [Pseudocyphellaria aurata]|nr:emp24p/erv25p- protein [Pseudocyphellaria aurata]